MERTVLRIGRPYRPVLRTGLTRRTVQSTVQYGARYCTGVLSTRMPIFPIFAHNQSVLGPLLRDSRASPVLRSRRSIAVPALPAVFRVRRHPSQTPRRTSRASFGRAFPVRWQCVQPISRNFRTNRVEIDSGGGRESLRSHGVSVTNVCVPEL